MSCVQHATRSALEMVQRWPLARAMGAGELVLLQVNACTLGGGDGADERAEWPTCRAKVSPRTLCAAPARPAEQLGGTAFRTSLAYLSHGACLW